MTWFHDPPSRGSWNMALDEALLHRAAQGAPPVLRFYSWEEPTLSFGYFQRYADRDGHTASVRCATVRRATGGGAILHDRELTYSCVLPAGHPLGCRAPELYNAVHTLIVAVLAEFGVAAGLAASAEGKTPFLCFARRTPGDILLDGWKIAGSAQRRQRGAVLQHGSILLERSPFAPELPGIHDLTTLRLDTSVFANRLRDILALRLGFGCDWQAPSCDLRNQAAALEAKFAGDSWLRQR